MQFHRQLAVRVLVPIIGVTLLLGIAAVAFVMYVTSRFAEDQADTNLRWRAYTVRQIADDHVDEFRRLSRSGAADVRDARVETLLAMEDFARSQGLLIAVFDETSQRVTKLGDLDVDPPEFTATGIDAVQRFARGDNRYEAFTLAFDPWHWRITVVQDGLAVALLKGGLVQGAWLAAGVLTAAAFLLMIYLATIMRRPIAQIVADVQAGRSPQYVGIAEFEFLSTSISRMMADLREKSAALERHGEDLENQVSERTALLTGANEELQKINRELAATHHQLLQSEKLASIGQLAAGVAHEINNPIAFVSSNLGSLEKYLRDLLRLIETYERHETLLDADGPAAAEIDAVKQAVEIDFLKQDIGILLDESRDGLARVRKIVQDLKEFSRTGGGDWQLADVHLGIDSTLNIVWNELKYKARVSKEYGELPKIECLPSELNQVFMNLLVNAGHAITDKGVITLRTAAVDGEVSIEVEDSGHGIAAADLPRIFEPFFTTKPVGQGTGLGLSLAYGIVQKHHGRIEVDSTPGRGTVFRVWLPVRQPAAAGDAGSPA